MPGPDREASMRMKTILLASAAALTAFVLHTSAPTFAQNAAALSGAVTSAKEGPMEGVVVSARKDGSIITVSVVSDDKGHFSFPASRLDPGHYAISIRATGYDLDGPKDATIAAGQEDKIDVTVKTERNLSAQVTNAEWLMRIPRTDDPPTAAKWLASINLSGQDTWSYPLKTLPRLTGKSTHVIITEYDMPNKLIEPQDVVLDHEGNVWYSDFGQMFIGEMDPKTGAVTQYPIPVTKPGYSLGTLDLHIDKDDNPWVGVMYQSAIAKLDRKTGKFETWSTPKEWDSDAGQLGHLAIEGTPTDDKVWIKNSAGGHIYRLDLKSNKFEDLGSPQDPRTGKRIGTYGIYSDGENNLYLLDFSAGNIVRIDAKTKQPTVFLTPTPNSHPRRGRVDDQGRLWFAEYFGNAIGMLDPETGKIEESKVPTPWSSPYDAVEDKNGNAWTGSMNTDRVARLDIKTGQYTEYPLPHPTNIRRVFVDDAKNPGTLWVGNNHGASIVKVEPLD